MASPIKLILLIFNYLILRNPVIEPSVLLKLFNKNCAFFSWKDEKDFDFDCFRNAFHESFLLSCINKVKKIWIMDDFRVENRKYKLIASNLAVESLFRNSHEISTNSMSRKIFL